MTDRYVQLLVAVQDLLIEIEIDPKDLRAIAAGADYPKGHVSAKITVKTAQKLIDAGVLEGVK